MSRPAAQRSREDLGLLAVTVLVGLALIRDQANALTITPSFDKSITAAPDAGAIENSSTG